ncbi:ATP-binding cassette domain-containing protein [Piscibacillus salipiscarius]|uniref:ATP-binding cassette domain-containing protein n=1 Tax=Piscibacillus salipiscarius TaxID=299480 RepID=UPI0034E2BE1C
MNVVVCKDVLKKYNKHLALDSLSVELKENRLIGLIGRNGAGKTTLLKNVSWPNCPD